MLPLCMKSMSRAYAEMNPNSSLEVGTKSYRYRLSIFYAIGARKTDSH